MRGRQAAAGLVVLLAGCGSAGSASYPPRPDAPTGTDATFAEANPHVGAFFDSLGGLVVEQGGARLWRMAGDVCDQLERGGSEREAVAALVADDGLTRSEAVAVVEAAAASTCGR